jgi:hypothetical protein
VGLGTLIRRRPMLAAMLGLPFVATLAASRLHLYPVTERTTLFLLPCLAVLTAAGIWWPARRIGGRTGLVLSAALTTAILLFPAYSAATHVVDPRTKEEVRPVLEAVLSSWKPGDTLYLHPSAQYAFRYYADCDCLKAGPAELSALLPFARVSSGSSDGEAIEPATPRLVLGKPTATASELSRELASEHGRVWFLHSHANGPGEATFLDRVVPRVLDDLGTRLAEIRRPGATAYLYRLP